MKRIVSALLMLCLFVGVGSLFAQQATVNHGVSLRGDPSTQKPPIGHLNRNSTVTLVAAKPKAGFYHVQTADGTKGWVGVKYLTVEGQAVTQPTPSPTPSESATPTPDQQGAMIASGITSTTRNGLL